MVIPNGIDKYALDTLLEAENGVVHGSFVICVGSLSVMKNGKKAALVFDGGSKHEEMERTIDGLPAIPSMRAVFLMGGDTSHIKQGAIVRIHEQKMTQIATGERVLVVTAADEVGYWPECKDLLSFVKHRLAMPESESPQSDRGEAPQNQNQHPSREYSNERKEKIGVPSDQYAPQRKVPIDTRNRAGEEMPMYPSESRRTEPYRPVERQPKRNHLKIKDLQQYTAAWSIVARVSKKSDMRSWARPPKEGVLFNVHLVDADDGEISGTFFNDACHHFYPLIKQGAVYVFSRGTIKPSRMRTANNDFEITFNRDAIIQEVEDAELSNSIPQLKLDVKSIAFAEECVGDILFDLVCVVSNVQETVSITIRSSGEPRDKKTIFVTDQSGRAMELTLWGRDCASVPDPSDEKMVGKQLFAVLRKLKTSDYNGQKQLRMSPAGDVIAFYADVTTGQWVNNQSSVDPNTILELVNLKSWYFEEGGKNTVPRFVNSIGTSADRKRATICQIKQEMQGDLSSAPEKGMYFGVIAEIGNFRVTRGRSFFKACTSCGKKVTGPEEQSDPLLADGGTRSDEPHYCAQCNKEEPNPAYRFNVQLDIRDCTDSLPCVALGDNAEGFMEATCREIEMARMNGRGPNGEQWEDYFNRQKKKQFLFAVSAKAENFNDEYRMKYRITGATPVAQIAKSECLKLIEKIDEILTAK